MATPYYNAGRAPVIVQGAPVKVQPTLYPSSPMGSYQEPLQDSHLPRTERRCHDVFWAMLFYAHLGGMLYCTIRYLPQAVSAAALNDDGDRLRRFLQDQGDDGQDANGDDDFEFDVDPLALLTILPICAAASIVVSTLALGFMMAFAETLVKLSLFFNIGLFAALSVMSFALGSAGSGIAFLLFTGVVSYYTCRVWDRIPFAASNLVTSVTAVRANLGLVFYAFLSVLLVFLWSLWWATGTMSTIYVTNGCQANGNCQTEVSGGIVFLFLLSYYWTAQVIANVVHCTTAGVTGTWWYAPHEANGCCSKAVRDSYVRSLTYSFGSICFASLVVAIIQSIREVVHSLRENGDSFLACLAECLIACIESLVELFNRFALVYCAVHGQSFLAAGRSVMDLFRARGWTTIITDYMVDTVLSMMSIGVGLLMGILALIIGAAMGQTRATLGMAFVLGFIVGYAVCAVLFSVVSSAVNSVIVLYAEAPNEFQVNHPELSSKMRAAWRQAWPNEFSY